MKYYAVKNGRKTGIYTSWEDTEKLVKGYPDAKYKSFKTRKDAEVCMGDGNEKRQSPPLNRQMNQKEITPLWMAVSMQIRIHTDMADFCLQMV